MQLKTLGFVLSGALLCTALLAVPSLAQTSADQRRASGERSVTGCLQREGAGFVLKNTEGTYELNTDRDLSAFVGKQVRISGKWDVSGTVTTAAGGNPPATGAAPTTAEEQQGPAPAFVGDLHLRITGTVIGDCEAPK